jgi:hypothetical protein
VVPFSALIDMYEGRGDAITPSVIIIPNLCVTAGMKDIPSWKVQLMFDLMLARAVKSKPTVGYVESIEGVVTSFGQPFADFLEGFITVG